MFNIPIEYIGYIASVLLILSFLMSNIRNIRIINFFGCLCFVYYGFFIGEKPAYPIIITNVVICLVQLYYLFIKKGNNL